MADVSMTGGCLCERVRFRYAGSVGGELGAATICHCRQCQKAQGYAAAVVPVLAAGLVIDSGTDLIREFESSPGKKRAFCVNCGSPIYSRLDAAPDRLRLRLGVLDEAPEAIRIEAHIFTENEPAWSRADDAPRYEGREPGRSA